MYFGVRYICCGIEDSLDLSFNKKKVKFFINSIVLRRILSMELEYLVLMVILVW